MGGMKSSLGIKILGSVAGDSQDCVANQETKNAQMRQVHADDLVLPQPGQDVHQHSRTKDDEGIEECISHSHSRPVFMYWTVDLHLTGCNVRHLRKRLFFCDYLRGSGH